ncbi:cyclase family protein [Actinocatenispora rupis]|uniref:cyclase family protein n=1 Tax=Actinocatenispora rupis TaxID=519421 RepID=UPI001EF20AB7|nr:cyclase family protein [Actinocatenispora rupis]
MSRRGVAAGGIAAVAGGLGGLALGGGPAAAGGGVRLDRMRLVSLSHVNDPATTNVFPGDPPFRFRTIATIPDDGYLLHYVEEGEHTGTHWGAPGHFNTGEPLADELDPSDLFLPAVKVDVREQCRDDPDYAVSVEDLKAWERRHGRIPDGAMVVLWTGWDAKWGTDAYPNADAEGVMHQPGFGLPAVRWLVDTGRLGRTGGTGTDTFSPDVGTDETYAVSKLVYQEHRISLEVLGNLAALPETGAWVLAGGPIHRHGAGSTATIFAFVPTD